MTLPPRLAQIGRAIEFRVAPPLYRGSRIVTLSDSSKREISRRLHLRPSKITVVPPGIDPFFAPPGNTVDPRDPDPLVVAVGRLVPVKRFDVLIDALADVKTRCPALRAVIVGDGYERDALERRIAELGAQDWISLPGRVDASALLDLYRRAWLVASASRHEGWGMTITEAAACGTPAVATRIAGHSDAIVDGVTGILTDDDKSFAAAIERVLRDTAFAALLAKNALEYSSQFTWAATARGTLEVLATEALRRKSA
jgi:glycosyltransferase involved in cell wall biosynthesis